MRITIIGWYGTETIGDRAILSGLISILNKTYNDCQIQLGSLYPFFSDRTIKEDYAFYEELSGRKNDINIFDSKNASELKFAIQKSDLLVMGGGPLMDLNELFMVEYAFKFAKKHDVKTAILGCGIGPLFSKKYRKSFLNIAKKSDIIILRDSNSKKRMLDIFHEFGQQLNADSVHVNVDPSIESLLFFKKKYKRVEQEYIAVNLREFPLEYNIAIGSKDINSGIKTLIEKLSKSNHDKEIRLIPMHYFHIGNDDRLFLNNIVIGNQSENVMVQNSNLSLKETMLVFNDAFFNVGMRFHAIVFQTVLVGNNYILDYTEPGMGKIYSFLKDIRACDFYEKRYASLQSEEIHLDVINKPKSDFNFDDSAFQIKLSEYINIIRNNENIDR